MKRFFCIIVFLFTLCSTGCSTSNNKEIASSIDNSTPAVEDQQVPDSQAQVVVPFGSEDLPKGEYYWDVERLFLDNGFTNIISVGSDALTAKLATMSDKVSMVTINGADFSEGDSFDPDAEVVIKYHSLSEREYAKVWGPPAVSLDEDRDEYIRRLNTVGSCIYLGTYEHDNNLENGPEPLKWLVMNTDGSKSLLLSAFIIDGHAYNDKSQAPTNGATGTWESCTLRQWLNSDFISTTFSEEESSHILTTTLDNHYIRVADQEFGEKRSIGPDTDDKVFIFDSVQLSNYITGTAYGGKLSPYAEAKGVYEMYWLRSPVTEINGALRRNDSVSETSYAPADRDDFGIRPAIWVDINSF